MGKKVIGHVTWKDEKGKTETHLIFDDEKNEFLLQKSVNKSVSMKTFMAFEENIKNFLELRNEVIKKGYSWIIDPGDILSKMLKKEPEKRKPMRIRKEIKNFLDNVNILTDRMVKAKTREETTQIFHDAHELTIKIPTLPKPENAREEEEIDKIIEYLSQIRTLSLSKGKRIEIEKKTSSKTEPKIERSTGIIVPGSPYRPGGGYKGLTDELDKVVQEEAKLLAKTFGYDVETRFNSDRKSGGAFIESMSKESLVKLGAGLGYKFPKGMDVRSYLKSKGLDFSKASISEIDKVLEELPLGIYIDAFITDNMMKRDETRASTRETGKFIDMKFDSMTEAMTWINENVNTLKLKYMVTGTPEKTSSPLKMQKRAVHVNSLKAAIEFYLFLEPKAKHGKNFYFQVNDDGMVYCSNYLLPNHSFMIITKKNRDDLTLTLEQMKTIYEKSQKGTYINFPYKNDEFYLGNVNISTTGIPEMKDKHGYDELVDTTKVIASQMTGVISMIIKDLKKVIDKTRLDIILSPKKLIINDHVITTASIRGTGKFHSMSDFRPYVKYLSNYCRSIIIDIANGKPMMFKCFGIDIGTFLLSPTFKID